MDSLKNADDACMVYVTVGSDDEARTIARAVVADGLAACVNILGPATSIYTWKGNVEESQEFVLICKTRHTLADVLATRVKALHSYDVPCITVYDMAAGYPPFLSWIADSTTSHS